MNVTMEDMSELAWSHCSPKFKTKPLPTSFVGTLIEQPIISFLKCYYPIILPLTEEIHMPGPMAPTQWLPFSHHPLLQNTGTEP